MSSENGATDSTAVEKRFEYVAFISYKREDVAWAKWLQQRLETYRLPSVIRQEAPHLPKHIRPVFRDQTDIGAGPLLESLPPGTGRFPLPDSGLFAGGGEIGVG